MGDRDFGDDGGQFFGDDGGRFFDMREHHFGHGGFLWGVDDILRDVLELPGDLLGFPRPFFP